MSVYSTEMVLVGIILLGAMSAIGIQIWLKRKKELKIESLDDTKHELDNRKDL